MKLWLDDERPPPDGTWIWAHTVDEAQRVLQAGKVTFASLDHDLGTKRDGHYLVMWMVTNDIWPAVGIEIHSWNIPRGGQMRDTIDRYGPYATRCLHVPYQTTDPDYI